jgi:hypothetical protein
MIKEMVEYFHFVMLRGDLTPIRTQPIICYVVKEDTDLSYEYEEKGTLRQYKNLQWPQTNLRSKYANMLGFIWKSLCVLTDNYLLLFYVLEMVITSTYWSKKQQVKPNFGYQRNNTEYCRSWNFLEKII